MSALFFDNEVVNTSMQKCLEKKLSQYNKIKFAYAIMDKKNPANFSIISNWMPWFELYIKEHCQFIDPVLIMASQRLTPFSWDENIMIGSGLRLHKIFDMAKDYNVLNGYTFVLHDHHHNLVVLSLIFDKNRGDNVEKRIEQDKDRLQMLLISTHEELTARYQAVNSPTNVEKMNGKAIFSPRENAILYWASMGKSYQEIALILGIKLATVKYHVGNAVKKLGVTNAKHAIRLGVELQLILPPDAGK
ncbi:LuxR family transcriptional regulator [Gibbsiella quercinecans]|uniref:LuxR family transcriptional regulator n=1 Tax=Gibbsiella quercinecans TaxID=929813 RepID=UPI002431C947|nr:LuxR family transcriptional regulator [Gibbsiella quercinecans]